MKVYNIPPLKVSRHPVREKKAPSTTALQRNGTGRDRRQKLKHSQQLTGVPHLESSRQGERQTFFAEQRHEPRPRHFPKRALHKGLQPPLAPTLHRPPVDAQRLPQNPHPLRGDPMVSRRDQHHNHTPVNPSVQKPHRRGVCGAFGIRPGLVLGMDWCWWNETCLKTWLQKSLRSNTG